MLTSLLLVTAIGSQSASKAPEGLPFLSPVFQDHMVLQRGLLNTFWGWTVPGAKVTVSVARHSAHALAGADGKWKVLVAPPPLGGPYSVTIDGPQHRELQDVLVGDVWLCGGQSNMELGITIAANPQAEVAAANRPQIRLAMVPRDVQLDARASIPVKWSVCTPDTVNKDGWGGFSAVGYYFGRELNDQLHVPIGLIEDCWGGTPAEAWISRPVVQKEGDFTAFLDKLDGEKRAGGTPYGQQIDAWLAKVDAGSKPDASWESPMFDDQGWQTTPAPSSFEKLGLVNFPGVVWFRGQIDLPQDLPSGSATLSLGAIEDIDTTWVNGQKVGESFLSNTIRDYSIPAAVLRPGHNLISIRALCTGAGGGLTYSPDALTLRLSDGRKIALSSGSWRYKTGPNIYARPNAPQPLEGNPYEPVVLYNGMIAPVAPIAIKGAIWYQGETNAGRAYQYRTILPDMIEDWRHTWGEGDFPFYIVQLANWQKRADQPGDSDWAELREAQELTARTVKNSGIATAVDIGDAVDIHPKNKQELGRRLALVALRDTYGQKVKCYGPTYHSAKRVGSTMVISFDHADGGLNTKTITPQGFCIAGPDRKFYWADANISGNTVVVQSANVKIPIAVRYGWANNPEMTLYNGEGLPALPFRTDDWKGVTYGKK